MLTDREEEFVRQKIRNFNLKTSQNDLPEKSKIDDRDGMKILVMSLLDMLNGKSFDEVMENFKGLEGDRE